MSVYSSAFHKVHVSKTDPVGKAAPRHLCSHGDVLIPSRDGALGPGTWT